MNHQKNQYYISYFYLPSFFIYFSVAEASSNTQCRRYFASLCWIQTKNFIIKCKYSVVVVAVIIKDWKVWIFKNLFICLLISWVNANIFFFQQRRYLYRSCKWSPNLFWKDARQYSIIQQWTAAICWYSKAIHRKGECGNLWCRTFAATFWYGKSKYIW